MRNRDKHRYQLFLEPRLAERLEELASRPGARAPTSSWRRSTTG
ncbi:hypothetical protein [Brevundimonas denitrificans]|nr:hypothetical protein [Brevundimonas denitrificans]